MSNEMIHVVCERIEAPETLSPVERFKRGMISETELEALLNVSKAAERKRDVCNSPGHDKWGAVLGSMSSRMNAELFNSAGELRSSRVIAALSGATVERVRNHLNWLKNRGRLSPAGGRNG